MNFNVSNTFSFQVLTINLGWSSSSLHLYTSGSPKSQLSLYPCTSNCPYITPILGQRHWLPADARISCTCMPPSQRCPPLPLLFVSLLSWCLTSTEARWPIRDGDRVGRGRESERLDRGNRPKKTGETVDRRQNNGSVKAVSPRHCPATCALRNCSFNCCAGQSH